MSCLAPRRMVGMLFLVGSSARTTDLRTPCRALYLSLSEHLESDGATACTGRGLVMGYQEKQYLRIA